MLTNILSEKNTALRCDPESCEQTRGPPLLGAEQIPRREDVQHHPRGEEGADTSLVAAGDPFDELDELAVAAPDKPADCRNLRREILLFNGP